MDYETSVKTTPRAMVEKHMDEWLALGRPMETA
jgi:hypothetical protein